MPETGGVRGGDPPSSWEAAGRVNVRKGWIDILGVLATYSLPRDNYPMCMVEIHAYLDDLYPYIDQITSRPHELVDRGFITEHPRQPRANRSGNSQSQNVYTITERGLEFWRAYTVLRPFSSFR